MHNDQNRPDLAAIRRVILADPTFLAQKLDINSKRALFVRFSADGYRQSSFLDDRILSPSTESSWLNFADVDSILADATPSHPLHFIFHAGHVGSTLVSRLLENSTSILPLREPLPLRALAEIHDTLDDDSSLVSRTQFEGLLRQQLVLWARGYSDTQAVVVKATSTSTRLAPALLAAHGGARAIYLYVPLHAYLLTLLSGEHSKTDLRGLAVERYRRLRALGVQPPSPLHSMDIGELAALGWIAERLSESALHNAHRGRVLSINFEEFLADPQTLIGTMRDHLGVRTDGRSPVSIASDPNWSRYSKAPEHAYSPQLRREILNLAAIEHADEFRKGLSWFERAARDPIVASLHTER